MTTTSTRRQHRQLPEGFLWTLAIAVVVSMVFSVTIFAILTTWF